MPRSGSSSWPASSPDLSGFRTVGRDLFLRGLVSSHSGNLSVLRGGSITITRHGSQLGHVGQADLVTVGLEEDPNAPPSTPAPSMELPRHRAIYRATGAEAIVHAHPPHAVALSLLEKEIVPRDVEGAYLLRQVPVVEPGEVAKEGLAEALASHPIAMLRGHGSFAVGNSLEEALQWTTALEDSCLILLWLGGAGGSHWQAP
ncbi:MAG: class II aldolase/adducin family protein [Chloroflexi bacterium]|nr:class II aldolase/adducin family protein [Chloroflexota bacterium]